MNIRWISWIFIGKTDAEAEVATWWEGLTHWKRPWCWERLRAGGVGDDRGWDDWVASPTQWTWFWTNSRREWRAGKPGGLQSMRLQRVGHGLATEQQKILRMSKLRLWWAESLAVGWGLDPASPGIRPSQDMSSKIKIKKWAPYRDICLFVCVLGFHCSGSLLAHGTWDLSSPTRDQTCISCIERRILNH